MSLNSFLRPQPETEVNGARRTRGILGALLISAAVLGSSIAEAEPPELCDMRLTVELTPDVPNSRDEGFLSSLLSNHVSYQLTFEGQKDDAIDSIILELTGPGPNYRCQNVIEAMRRDGRVLSVHVRRVLS